VKSVASTLLLELSSAQVPQVAEALPGWRYTVERQTTQLPERKPLQRAQRGAVLPGAEDLTPRRGVPPAAHAGRPGRQRRGIRV
jgi:hypothetical protein